MSPTAMSAAAVRSESRGEASLHSWNLGDQGPQALDDLPVRSIPLLQIHQGDLNGAPVGSGGRKKSAANPCLNHGDLFLRHVLLHDRVDLIYSLTGRIDIGTHSGLDIQGDVTLIRFGEQLHTDPGNQGQAAGEEKHDRDEDQCFEPQSPAQ